MQNEWSHIMRLVSVSNLLTSLSSKPCISDLSCHLVDIIRGVQNCQGIYEMLVCWWGFKNGQDETRKSIARVMDVVPGNLEDFIHPSGEENVKREILDLYFQPRATTDVELMWRRNKSVIKWCTIATMYYWLPLYLNNYFNFDAWIILYIYCFYPIRKLYIPWKLCAIVNILHLGSHCYLPEELMERTICSVLSWGSWMPQLCI